MNVTPNVSDWEHVSNLELLAQLRAQGFKIEYGSQGYRVERSGKFLHAAGTINKPHGRYRAANTRDNLQSALRIALNHCKAETQTLSA